MTPTKPSSRRHLLQGMLAGLGLFSLSKLAYATEALNPSIKPNIQQWLSQLEQLCQDLKDSQIPATLWQTEIESLLHRVDEQALFSLIDYQQLISQLKLPKYGVTTKVIQLPRISGITDGKAYLAKIFAMNPYCAIIPHGHDNMASSHRILQGQLHVRQYQRFSETDNSYVLQPTVDEIAGPGHASSISDDHNNVHWFQNLDQPAYALDIIMLDLNGKRWHVQNLDPDNATLVEDQLHVPKMPVLAALDKYGRRLPNPS